MISSDRVAASLVQYTGKWVGCTLYCISVNSHPVHHWLAINGSFPKSNLQCNGTWSDHCAAVLPDAHPSQSDGAIVDSRNTEQEHRHSFYVRWFRSLEDAVFALLACIPCATAELDSHSRQPSAVWMQAHIGMVTCVVYTVADVVLVLCTRIVAAVRCVDNCDVWYEPCFFFFYVRVLAFWSDSEKIP